jgi:hypothetical protein
VDLGRLRELTGVEVGFASRRHAVEYRVETSVDGRVWTVAARDTTGTSGAGRVEFTGLGRYVRVTVARCAAPARLTTASVLGTR